MCCAGRALENRYCGPGPSPPRGHPAQSGARALPGQGHAKARAQPISCHPSRAHPRPPPSAFWRPPNCGNRPDPGRSPGNLVFKAWQLQGPQPAQSAPPPREVLSIPEPSHQGAAAPPSPAARKGPSPEEQREEARGPLQPPLPLFWWAAHPPHQCCGSGCLGTGLPDRQGSEGWPERGGSAASAESTGREVERPGGRASGSRSTGRTDLGQALVLAGQAPKDVARGPDAHTGRGAGRMA